MSPHGYFRLVSGHIFRSHFRSLFTPNFVVNFHSVISSGHYNIFLFKPFFRLSHRFSSSRNYGLLYPQASSITCVNTEKSLSPLPVAAADANCCLVNAVAGMDTPYCFAASNAKSKSLIIRFTLNAAGYSPSAITAAL